jgi:hypothetical protein
VEEVKTFRGYNFDPLFRAPIFCIAESVVNRAWLLLLSVLSVGSPVLSRTNWLAAGVRGSMLPFLPAAACLQRCGM